LLFGDLNDNFTTTNPKVLAAIAGRPTEGYDADTDGGMELTFWTSLDNPGTAPSLSLAGVMNKSQTFSPTLQAVTTDPTLGSGSLNDGFWVKNGPLVEVWQLWKFGSTGLAAGTGDYYIDLSAESLPAPKSGFGHADWRVVGQWMIYDDSDADTEEGPCVLDDNGNVYFMWQSISDTFRFVNEDDITTWATNDVLSVHFSYLAL